jgi:hypothetical protein
MKDLSWMDHPAVKEMNPAKLAILLSFADNATGKTPEKILPLLMQANSQLKSQDLTFTKEEQELLIDILSKDMSPAEKQRIEMVKKMIARNKR